jgi:hypothetical protein
VTTEPDDRVLVAEARIARQRVLIARIEASGKDASEAKSLLSAMRYSLRLLRRHQRRAKQSGPITTRATGPRDHGSA